MTRDTNPHAHCARQSGNPSLDHLLDAIRRSPRRRVLTALSDEAPREVAEFTPADGDGGRSTAALTSLRHHHLPYLDAADFVDWDRDAGAIRRGPRYDEVEALLEVLRSNQDALPTSWP